MMNNELLLLYRKYIDTFIEQTKTKLQETLEPKMNNQWETFLFNPSIKLAEEGKCLLAVTSFEAINFVFNTHTHTNENKSFSISTPSH